MGEVAARGGGGLVISHFVVYKWNGNALIIGPARSGELHLVLVAMAPARLDRDAQRRILVLLARCDGAQLLFRASACYK